MRATRPFVPLGSAMRPYVPLEVRASDCGNSFDRMFQRFKRLVKEEGRLRDHRMSLRYMKPSQGRRMKRKAALAARMKTED